MLFLDCFACGRMDEGGTKNFNVEGIFHAVWDIDFSGVDFACFVC